MLFEGLFRKPDGLDEQRKVAVNTAGALLVEVVAGGGGAGGATETTLAAILAELRDDVIVLSTDLWEDRSAAVAVFYRESITRSTDNGAITTTITRLSDNTVVPSLPVGAIPVAGANDREIVPSFWTAGAAGTGVSIGDSILNIQIVDKDGTGAVLSSLWYNRTTGAALTSAPTNLTVAGQAFPLGILPAQSSLATTKSQRRVVVGVAGATNTANTLQAADATTSVIGYQSCFFQVAGGIGVTAGTVYPETSADGVNWVPLAYLDLQTNQIGTAPIGVTAASAKAYSCATPFQFFRIGTGTNVNGGGVTVTAEFSQEIWVGTSSTVSSYAPIEFNNTGLSIAAGNAINTYQITGRSRGSVTVVLGTFATTDPAVIVEFYGRPTATAPWDKIGQTITIPPPPTGSTTQAVIHWANQVAIESVRVNYISGGGTSTRVTAIHARFEGGQ